MKQKTRIAAAFGLVLAAAVEAFAASAVQGRLTSDGCTGRPVVAHGWDEEIIYLSPIVPGVTGGGCTTLVNPRGWYSITGSFPAGEYLLSTLGFDGIPAFSVSQITLPGGSVVVDPVELRTPAHYSVAFDQHYNEWGSEPWIWGSDFYQTFTATSSGVTRVATRLAGKSGDHYWMTLNFGIYQPNGGPPSTWPLISPVRSYYYGGGVDPIIVIGWAPYRSSEMALTAGATYALRLWVAPGSQATSFALVARTDQNNGYADGHLYVGDTARPDLDAYAYISGGSPGTVTHHAPVLSYELVTLANWSTRFGQTFRATGSSLAGAAVVYTTGEAATPSLPIAFQLYDSPGGMPIGPSRTTHGVHGFFQGRASVAWLNGEVPLTPGEMYHLEWTPPASGCNTWYMNENLPGEAYVGGVSRAPSDLIMAIAEYDLGLPAIGLSTAGLSYSVKLDSPPFTDSFTVRNSSAGTLNYDIRDDVDWLSVSPDAGTSTGEDDTIEVTVTPQLLGVGTHAATVTITAPGASNSPRAVQVALMVEPYRGDLDLDRDVDMEDWGRFQLCLGEPGVPQTAPSCQYSDLDADGDVDGRDTNLFIPCLSGSGVPASGACEQ